MPAPMSSFMHHRGECIEDIYFFEANAEYISSSVLKISVISRVHSASGISDIFNIFDENFWYLSKKVNTFIFCLRKTNRIKIN